MTNNALLRELQLLLGSNKVTTEAGVLDSRSHDFWLVDFQRRLHGTPNTRPFAVVLPSSAADVSTLLRFANEKRIGIVPFGAGSGVCGGARPQPENIVLDLSELNAVLDLNEIALTVTVQPGILGKDLESYLNARGYSMGHFPQSMNMSSVGGWVATRASGQFSTKYGSIEHMLVCLQGCLADGTLFQTKNAPRASTGPSVNELVLGSEGTLAVLTELTFKIHPLPAHQAKSAFRFANFSDGLDAVRKISRIGVKPALLRLYDATESRRHFGKVARDNQCILLILCEGPKRIAQAELAECGVHCFDAGGLDLGADLVEHWLPRRFEIPDINDLAVNKGVIFDTVEIAANWDSIGKLYEDAIAALRTVNGIINASAHSSHTYQQGTCLYFSFAVKKPRWLGRQASRLLGNKDAFVNPGDLAAIESAYDDCWQKIMESTLANGGTISHHHGVGRVRRQWLQQELGASLDILTEVKRTLDPNGILNPGSLFPSD